MDTEVWDYDDVYCAFLQAQLISYMFITISQEGCERLRKWNLDGAYTPTNYAHSCPWNDGTPPSEAHRRAATARDALRTVGLARIRVHACCSPDSLQYGENSA